MRNILFMSLATAALCTGCNTRNHSEQSSVQTLETSKSYILVEPETTRSIQGVTEVERQRYFSVCDPGGGFENRIKDDEMYDYLVNELQISFGRLLGPIKYPARNLKEDPTRPGFADLEPLKKLKPAKSSDRFKQDFGPNLDVAAHGQHNAFPEFMGRFETELSVKGHHPQFIPQNIEAAAELSAAVLKHGYSDFTRPRYYELVNEPHWQFFPEQHMADWHMVTKDRVKELTPEVQVGGLCMSVCYFYRADYKSFTGMDAFIKNTNCEMDFYSFHTYDYLRWNEAAGDFNGRLQSGSPLEGTLDIVQNFTMNEYGREVDVVVSEHGGYIGSQPKGEYDGEVVAAGIMAKHYPDADTTSWDYEMKKRSITAFGHVSSIISNTLGFMDHPHTVKKAVPFLLVNTWSWGPKYYAGLYVPYEYTDKTNWVETDLTAFYKLFRGVEGRRVKALSNDPDLQSRAFVNGDKLYLAVNNQSFGEESVALHGIDVGSIEVRRFGRNADFTAYYKEERISTPDVLKLAGRESVMIVADYGKTIDATGEVNEIVCYADTMIQPVKDATFTIKVPVEKDIDYAQLRIGYTRAPESSQAIQVQLNGKQVTVPVADSADRFVDKEFATTALVYLNVDDLTAENVVTISFPDGDDGFVGSAVIRAAVK